MYKEKISAWVDAHKDEMLEDICELCRVNSEKMPAEEDMPFGPGTAECLDMALDMAEGYGFETCDYDGYVGCVDMNELPHQLDILAHLDVVPAGEGWTVTEPFKPVLKDGKLYGRGTADDKGPAVAALYAMRAVKELGIPLKKNVRLILGTDEECGSSNLINFVRQNATIPVIETGAGICLRKPGTLYEIHPCRAAVLAEQPGSHNGAHRIFHTVRMGWHTYMHSQALFDGTLYRIQIGRASCRERV